MNTLSEIQKEFRQWMISITAMHRLDPNDNTPRLVFSDWLQEQADPHLQAYGKFIPLHIKLWEAGMESELLQVRSYKQECEEIMDGHTQYIAQHYIFPEVERWDGWLITGSMLENSKTKINPAVFLIDYKTPNGYHKKLYSAISPVFIKGCVGKVCLYHCLDYIGYSGILGDFCPIENIHSIEKTEVELSYLQEKFPHIRFT